MTVKVSATKQQGVEVEVEVEVEGSPVREKLSFCVRRSAAHRGKRRGKRRGSGRKGDASD